MAHSFRILSRDPSGRARAGVLSTAHGEVETPVFMPVATQASVKALEQGDLARLGAKALLSNSYHLYLRPGADVIEAAGGLHAFMNYPGTLLTDSGGFQVFSLADLRTLSDEGVTFQSHHDGSRHDLTPRGVIRLQARLGSDIWTALDECPPYPAEPARVRRALTRTRRWAELSREAFREEKDRGARALFFPILQGGLDAGLRREAAEHLLALEPDGISLGGFSVGEPKALTWDVLGRTTEALSEPLPRYLMGMGAPEDFWEAASLGVDMMDCVWPTRMARNGQLQVPTGRLSIKNAAMRKDFSPVDPECGCWTCKHYTRAYLCHLFRARELSAFRLLTLHNLHFSLELMRRIRRSILNGNFSEEKRKFFETYRCAAGARDS